jgi:hypothetical protein
MLIMYIYYQINMYFNYFHLIYFKKKNSQIKMWMLCLQVLAKPEKNVEIVRPDVMTKVRTRTPSLVSVTL